MKNNKMRFKKRSNGKHNNGGSGRIRENAQKMLDHYSHLARESAGSDDRVLAEYYWQHVDHYRRVLQEHAPPPSVQDTAADDHGADTAAQIIDIEEILPDSAPAGVVEIAFEEAPQEAEGNQN